MLLGSAVCSLMPDMQGLDHVLGSWRWGCPGFLEALFLSNLDTAKPANWQRACIFADPTHASPWEGHQQPFTE